MLKRVKFSTYQILRIIYKITIVTASDTEAVILISK